MKVKWECVWGVLKPKIIAFLLVVVIIIVIVTGMTLVVGYYLSQPIDYTNMSVAQQQVVISQGCGCGIQPMAIILPILFILGIIGAIGLTIEYLKALAEALKPCIIWKEE